MCRKLRRPVSPPRPLRLQEPAHQVRKIGFLHSPLATTEKAGQRTFAFLGLYPQALLKYMVWKPDSKRAQSLCKGSSLMVATARAQVCGDGEKRSRSAQSKFVMKPTDLRKWALLLSKSRTLPLGVMRS